MIAALNRFKIFTLISLASSMGLAACATSPQPVLYPNEHLQRVGEAQAKRDIAYCEVLAQEYVHNQNQVKRAAEDTLAGSAGGAALGAIGGTIAGSAGAGAAIGAAVGAAGGILGSLIKNNEPNPTYERFVEHCLERHGYDPTGWSS